MGGSSSTQTQTSIMNSICTNAVTSVIDECMISTSTNQSVNANCAGNVTIGNITTNSTQNTSSNCQFSNSVTQTAVNNLQETLNTQITQQLDSWGLSSSSASTNTNVSNIVQNNITVDSVNECITQALANQSVNVTSGSSCTIGNLNLTDAQTSTVNCIVSNIVNDLVQSGIISGTNESTSTTTSNPIDSLLNSLSSGSTTSSSYIIYIIAFVVIIGILYYIYQAIASSDTVGRYEHIVMPSMN